MNYWCLMRMGWLMKIKLVALVRGYAGKHVCLIALANTDSQEIAISNPLDFYSKYPKDDHTVIVTDSPNLVNDYQLAFREAEHLKEAIICYEELFQAGKITLKERSCDPSVVLQTFKVDTKGKQKEFNTDELNNSHIAALLIVWAAHRAFLNHQITNNFTQEDDQDLDNDDFSTPFLI